MARPQKDGLDYFPLDVDIFEDEKIEAIAGEFGPKGELAVIKLLCAIYKKGYFILWDDLTQATLLKRLPGASKEMINQIVNRLVLWGFFNEELFNSVRVLTSKNIQATYFEATKRRKMQKPTLHLINDDINAQVIGVNDDINAQSKVKETKVNKTKVNKNKQDTEILFEEFFKIFTDSHSKNFKKRAEALSLFVRELSPEEREQALIGAKNYIKSRERDGENPDFGSNPAVFLESMEFKEYQEIPPIPKKNIKKPNKQVKGLPDWSSLNDEPEEVEADW